MRGRARATKTLKRYVSAWGCGATGDDHLGYFREWKKVRSLPLEAGEQRRMMIIRETMEGLEITGKTFQNLDSYIAQLRLLLNLSI